MVRTIHHIKQLLYIIIIATAFLLSKESKGQCNDSIYTNSTCLTTNSNIQFLSSFTSGGAWWVYDGNGILADVGGSYFQG